MSSTVQRVLLMVFSLGYAAAGFAYWSDVPHSMVYFGIAILMSEASGQRRGGKP